MGIIRSVLLIAFLAWLAFRIIIINRILHTLGFGIPVFNHAPGPCKVFYVNGSEDIDVLPNGLAIISSGLKLSLGDVDPVLLDREGRLYAFNLNTPEQGLRELELQDFSKSNFIPHGIDSYTDPETQKTYLFVINQGGSQKSVEIFEFNQDHFVLKHWKTVTDENIYFPNDVVAVGRERFYVTNTHYFGNTVPVVNLIDVCYPLKLGTVAFYNGTHSKIVDGGLHTPNGINIDKTGQYVFVVACFGGEIMVYKRTEDNSLEKVQEISVGMTMDNIFADENDNLWTGSPNLCFFEHSKNLSHPCPGKILQLKMSKRIGADVPFKVDDILEVFSTDGRGDIRATSTAVFYKGKLLIGTIFSNLLYCEVVAT